MRVIDKNKKAHELKGVSVENGQSKLLNQQIERENENFKSLTI